jgi:hypothetical protein
MVHCSLSEHQNRTTDTIDPLVYTCPHMSVFSTPAKMSTLFSPWIWSTPFLGRTSRGCIAGSYDHTQKWQQQQQWSLAWSGEWEWVAPDKGVLRRHVTSRRLFFFIQNLISFASSVLFSPLIFLILTNNFSIEAIMILASLSSLCILVLSNIKSGCFGSVGVM